jgi:exopolyphosphatase/guanosine-5'-triphosphate,3'-diphosphate pyrophosphatase
MALHGNWVTVTPSGRVIMAQALASNFGRDNLPDPALAQLCKADHLKRAHCWGLAMRLGQRLSGGVGTVLKRTSLSFEDEILRLTVAKGDEALVGDPVQRRLAQLAEMLGARAWIASS